VPDPRVERTRRRIILVGDVPNPLAPPPGCRFSSRCPVAIARCGDDEPPLEAQGGAGHLAACWRSAELDAAMSAAAERTSRAAAGG
jgi:oligopeptide transport system ATP-binding protein